MSRFVVGLTGGIGSGKTAVSDRFQALGIQIVDADVASRAVLEPGEPAFAAVVEHFGPTVLRDDGRLDRAELRSRVFADPAERQWLEQLTHPLIGAWIRERILAGASSYCLLVNPLLVESRQAQVCHRVLVVDAPEQAQLARTMARDGNDEAQVRAIMAAQAARADRLAAAHDVIINDGHIDHLDREVARLHPMYLELSRP